jgi:hypothetical protein
MVEKPNSFSITAKLERIEGEFAVLRNEAMGEFKWPLAKLPAGVKVGDTVTLKVNSSDVEKDEQYARMRKLLEELIN